MFKQRYSLILIFSTFLQCIPSLKSNQSYIVSRVIDGDTIIINNKERVRLIGIDAPELSERCGAESKKKLEELIQNKNITLEKDVSERDKYNRLLRYVYINDKHANLEMIKAGYATNYPYPPDTKYKDKFKEVKNEAKLNKRGCLWK